MSEYFKNTKHPWACLIFILPLLIGYEAGVFWLGGQQSQSLRNGVDSWLRWALDQYGFNQLWVVPLIVVGLFLVWSFYRWNDRPKNMVSLYFSMLLECGLLAALLWAISVNFKPILDRFGIQLLIDQAANAGNQPLSQSLQAKLLVRYIGAGIYEEVVFRLGLFTAIYILLRLAFIPGLIAGLLAAIAAAILFSAAHHIGEAGEPYIPIRFMFRVLAGFYFTMLYIFRGLGIAIGAHAGYDVLVGIAN